MSGATRVYSQAFRVEVTPSTIPNFSFNSYNPNHPVNLLLKPLVFYTGRGPLNIIAVRFYFQEGLIKGFVGFKNFDAHGFDTEK
jgi:hypothetical protein